MDHGQVVRLAMRERELGGLLQRLAGNDDLGAVTPGVLDFTIGVPTGITR